MKMIIPMPPRPRLVRVTATCAHVITSPSARDRGGRSCCGRRFSRKRSLLSFVGSSFQTCLPPLQPGLTRRFSKSHHEYRLDPVAQVEGVDGSAPEAFSDIADRPADNHRLPIEAVGIGEKFAY